jgi:diaminopimelate decarboxylase
MDHFSYKDGLLHCEDASVADIAADVDTPCYIYSRATLLDHFDKLVAAFKPLQPLMCYSIKSCSNLAVLKLLRDRGAGMDLVSGGELHRAMAAGVDPAMCVYAGVGKSDAEIRQALQAGVGWFNVESEAEFENIAAIAKQMNLTCKAALRINPDVDPSTHRYTTTGKKETKFGVDIERARAFFRSYGQDAHCHLRGIHLHLGSPIYSASPYVQSIEKVLHLMDELASDPTQPVVVEMLDLGGGYGADYETDQSPLAIDYANEIVPLLRDRVEAGLQIILEPGRSITANAGILLTRVLYMKTSGDKTFAICDGGMNVLIRPSHYEAFHFIWPAQVREAFVPRRRAKDMNMTGLVPMDVVGPICETGDFLALDRPLPPMQRGDLLAVFSAGAYGMVMASRYNAMPLPPEVLVDGGQWTVIRRRETYDDLIAHEL